MTRTTVTVTTEIDIDVKTGAKWFCGLNDEDQAQFFIEAAEVAKAWTGHQSFQWWLVGRHLRECECSTYEARELINEIASGINSKREQVAA